MQRNNIFLYHRYTFLITQSRTSKEIEFSNESKSRQFSVETHLSSSNLISIVNSRNSYDNVQNP